MSIRPSRSFRTCAAVVGDGRPDAFADGAANGRPESEIRRRARGEDGMRTPTVWRVEEISVHKGDGWGRGRMIVRGPGQKRDIKGW
jgi:hypothetical protein